ncbi:MAG: hypothetical protein M1825_002649 [Sarcosagium campestre]|nr:MAG: hypothetical protein M1825_002649 [Sarcosagium campestre]
MSSSQPFVHSSPLSPTVGPSMPRRRSVFTYRHLSQLAQSSTSCPLRVIAHIDLDGFYAQCETVRLGLSEDQPLAVQQWQGLIAINYAARKFGLTRHIDIDKAKELCPQLITQHVATWREGDAKWAYHDNAASHISTHKVSLDPYRLECRKILAAIKDVLPPPPIQRVEKASIDEVFLDLSAQIHGVLLERYPELADPAPYDDPTENLPRPPTTALDWKTDALIDLDSTETEDDDPDWDDIAMLVASQIVSDVRAAIRARLKYTCSAGIAHNKMLSKLGSGYRKPNQQTVIRNRAGQQFLSDLKFTKIRNLGGKLGEDIVSRFGSDTIKDLLQVPLDQLKLKLGDDTGSWVHQTIRGIDLSEVNSRTQIKSMLSAKSFRPSINSFDQATRWLRIFVADIFSRLVEEGVLENKRRPHTINLHHRQGGQTKSRQAPIPQGRTMTEELLFDLSKNLLSQVIAEGRAWPCANLSLSVGGFEDGLTGNRGIGSFLVKGEEARAMNATERQPEVVRPESRQSQKKKRRLEGDSIRKFFVSHDDDGAGSDGDVGHQQHSPPAVEDIVRQASPSSKGTLSLDSRPDHDQVEETSNVPPLKLADSTDRIVCDRCDRLIVPTGKQEHDDWHLARDIQDAERVAPNEIGVPPDNQLATKQLQGRRDGAGPRGRAKRMASKNTNVTSASSRVEKGQSKLAFGR